MNTIATPSYHQIGDRVSLDLQHCGVVKQCEVIAVHFYEGHVRYDLSVIFDEEDADSNHTTIEQIDSVFVRALEPEKDLALNDQKG